MSPLSVASSMLHRLSPALQQKATNELFSSDGWFWRRLTLWGALTFLALSIGFITVRNIDSPLNEQIAFAEIAAFTSLVGTYVFAAVWDDRNKRDHLCPKPQVDPEPADDAEKPADAPADDAGATTTPKS